MAINNNFGTGVLDELIVSGSTALHTRAVGLAQGGLKRGQLIGWKDVTGTDSYAAYGNDGHNEVFGVLAGDVAEGETNAIVYVSGHFNANKIIGYADSLKEELRKKGIFVEKALAY